MAIYILLLGWRTKENLKLCLEFESLHMPIAQGCRNLEDMNYIYHLSYEAGEEGSVHIIERKA